jgi:hypothetical protein
VAVIGLNDEANGGCVLFLVVVCQAQTYAVAVDQFM